MEFTDGSLTKAIHRRTGAEPGAAGPYPRNVCCSATAAGCTSVGLICVARLLDRDEGRGRKVPMGNVCDFTAASLASSGFVSVLRLGSDRGARDGLPVEP